MCIFFLKTIPWQSLGESVRRPRRPQVAKQELVEVADGGVDVLIGRSKVAKLVHSGVLRDELLLVVRVLQSQSSSL